MSAVQPNKALNFLKQNAIYFVLFDLTYYHHRTRS